MGVGQRKGRAATGLEFERGSTFLYRIRYGKLCTYRTLLRDNYVFPGFFAPAKFVTLSTAPVVKKYCLSEITAWISKNYVRHNLFIFYTGQKSLNS